MKAYDIKLILLILHTFLFSFTILLAEQTDTIFTGRVYEYSQVEGEKWEGKLAYQLPDSVLYGYTTEELLHTCLNYPYISLIYVYNTIGTGLSQIYRALNGFEVLLKRNDIFKHLCNNNHILTEKFLINSDPNLKANNSFRTKLIVNNYLIYSFLFMNSSLTEVYIPEMYLLLNDIYRIIDHLKLNPYDESNLLAMSLSLLNKLMIELNYANLNKTLKNNPHKYLDIIIDNEIDELENYLNRINEIKQKIYNKVHGE